MKRILKDNKYYFILLFLVIIQTFLMGCDGTSEPNLKTLTIQPSPNAGKDSMVVSNYPMAKYGDSPALQIGKDINKDNIIRSYLQFDLSALPVNAHVVYADLKLYLKEIIGNDSFNINVHAVTEGWSEEDIKWTNQPNYSGTVQSSISVNADDTNWLSWDIRFLVYDWVEGNIGNYGLVLKDDDYQGDTFVYCWSSDYGYEPELRPKLVITYSES